MEFHELSNLLPFREEQVDAIEMRMRQTGWKPGSVVTLFEGKILDGRHRYLAAERAGIEPVYAEYQGDSALYNVAQFVVLENCESRHLSNDEKYQLLCDMREKGFWSKHPPNRPSSRSKEQLYQTNVEIAKILGLSENTVRRWDSVGRDSWTSAKMRRDVRENAIPEVVDAMESGDLTTKDAVALSNLPEDEQAEALREKLADPKKPIRVDTSGNDEWYTPANYIDMAREVMGGIDLDPASCETAQKAVQASTFHTINNSGLDHAWKGRVWMNPPYSKGLIDAFVDHLCDAYESGGVTQAIVLTHNFTDTAWFHKLAHHSDAWCGTRGRVRFYTEDGVGNSPTSGHVFFYFGPNVDQFKAVFRDTGFVVQSV